MSPSRRPRRTVLALGALGAVLALLVAEGVARWLAPALPPPDRFGDGARAAKAAQMAELADAEGCVDVVVVGDSMARDGLVPGVLSDADPAGRSAYNASLDAAGPELLGPWLDGQVLPRLHPATVVVAISSIGMNDGSPGVTAATEAWDASLAGRGGLLGSLDRWASDRLALVEHRRELRDPEALWDALVDRLGGGEAAVEDPAAGAAATFDDRGAGLSRRELTYEGPGAATAFTRDQLLADFDLGGDPAGRVAELVAVAGSDGADVVVVVLPVTDDFAGLHPGGAEDLEAAREAIVEGAEAAGAPVVDLLDEAPPEDRFADTHHLNGEGADELSAELPDLLAEAGVPVRTCTP